MAFSVGPVPGAEEVVIVRAYVCRDQAIQGIPGSLPTDFAPGWPLRLPLPGWLLRLPLPGWLLRLPLPGWLLRLPLPGWLLRLPLPGWLLRLPLPGWLLRLPLPGSLCGPSVPVDSAGRLTGEFHPGVSAG